MDKDQGGGTLGYYVEDYPDKEGSLTIIISASSEVGKLAYILDIFKKNIVNLRHIESRPSKTDVGNYDFLINADNKTGGLEESLEELKKQRINVKVLARNQVNKIKGNVPWFPRKIKDLDRFANQILSYGSELEADHPGFTDETYRKRRKEFADIAFFYRHGQQIPRVEYTEEEVNTWATVFDKLTSLYPTHACKEFNYIFPLLQQNCDYNKGNIPQLQDVSDFLRDCTGFTLRPVAGLLSSRDFLAGLAFRVFHSTQYIRHSKVPLYTPEPDVCHELLGHVPLFCNPDFAQFSQELGLASLGASDDFVQKLATCYWFTIEFGLCKEGDNVKAYGAGLLSSFGELQYAISSEPELKPFEPERTSVQSYPITKYQPVYFVASNFNNAKKQLIEFSKIIERPFSVKYDPYSQSVVVIDSKEQLKQLLNEVNYNMSIMEDAMFKLIANE